MKHTILPKNEEEILLEEEDEDLQTNSCMTTEAVSTRPVVLRKGSRNDTIVTIPNSHDLHVVAAVLGSAQEESRAVEPLTVLPGSKEHAPLEDTREAEDHDEDQDIQSASSSSESDDEDDDEDVLVCDSYNDLKHVIDDMMANHTHDDHGPYDPSRHQSAAELLFGADSSAIESLRQTLNDIHVQPDDVVVEAGRVVNCLEGTIVINALPGSELLGEGSILVHENKTIIGSIEDIIGPVQSPMYVLMDPSLLATDEEQNLIQRVAPGDIVYSVPSLSKKILDQEDLRVKGYDAGDAEEVEDIPECEFSDDEAEAAYKRSLHGQKVAPDVMPVSGEGKPKKRNRQPRQRRPAPPQQDRPTTVAEFYALRESGPQATKSNPSFLPVSFQNHHASS